MAKIAEHDQESLRIFHSKYLPAKADCKSLIIVALWAMMLGRCKVSKEAN